MVEEFGWNQLKHLEDVQHSNYVLIYGIVAEEFIQSIITFADRNSLIIISVGYYNKFATYNYVDAGPIEWLCYMKNASFIYTNFYHGLLFSIIFNKPYKVFIIQSKSR